jgi:hypothetical protein
VSVAIGRLNVWVVIGSAFVAIAFVGEPPPNLKFLFIALISVSLLITLVALRYELSLFALFCAAVFLLLFVVRVAFSDLGVPVSSSVLINALLLCATVKISGTHRGAAYMQRLYFFLITFLPAWYVLEWFFLAPNQRPDLFVENNFEVMIPMLLHVILKVQSGSQRLTASDLYLVPTVMLSGSLSALACLAGWFALIILKRFRTHLSKNPLLALAGLMAVGVGLAVILDARGYTVDRLKKIDRVQFYSHAVSEVQNSPEAFIFRFTDKELSAETCEKFAGYKNLVEADGTCFSRVLHAGLIRGVLDYGIMGWIIINTLVFQCLRIRFGASIAFQLFILMSINSLSVSGLYSSVIFYPIWLAALLHQTPAKRCDISISGGAL